MLVGEIKNTPIDSNCFVLYDEAHSSCIVIDPGTENCLSLLQFLDRMKLIPEYTILTHEHFDHIWGVDRIKELYQAKTICSKNCAEKIIDKKKNMSLFFDQKGFVTSPADLITEELGNKLNWQNLEIRFIETKGHTDGSICIWCENMLFTGDTINMDKKTVVKFPSGSKKELIDSLRILYETFNNKNIIVFPGHGESFLFNEIVLSKLI